MLKKILHNNVHFIKHQINSLIINPKLRPIAQRLEHTADNCSMMVQFHLGLLYIRGGFYL